VSIDTKLHAISDIIIAYGGDTMLSLSRYSLKSNTLEL